jgi:uncharacterized Zn finger protein
MTEETKETTGPEYTNFEIPVEEMTENQQLMLAILMQEGALRMRELIVAKLEAGEDNLTKDGVIAMVSSTMPNIFEDVSSVEESDEKDESDASTSSDLHK